MPRYVDGFLLVVPTKRLGEYRTLSRMPFDDKRMSMGGFSVLVDA